MQAAGRPAPASSDERAEPSPVETGDVETGDVGLRRCAGLLVEPVGGAWAVFSSSSGETHLLNDAAAALLELLEAGPANVIDLQFRLAEDMGISPEDLGPLVVEATEQLRHAGLVQRLGH